MTTVQKVLQHLVVLLDSLVANVQLALFQHGFPWGYVYTNSSKLGKCPSQELQMSPSVQYLTEQPGKINKPTQVNRNTTKANKLKKAKINRYFNLLLLKIISKGVTI